jgi:protein-disulfide isomerase
MRARSEAPRGEILAAPVTERDHVDGPADAPATLVVYGDYECPYTRAAHLAVRRAQSQLGSRMRYVFRHFPLTSIHPHAEHAALAAESAFAQGGEGAFWAMHDQLFRHQDALDDAHLARYATAAGVDGVRLAADVARGAYLARVGADVESGLASGVRGTPALFVNGSRYSGDRSAPALAAVLAAAAAPPG